MEKQGLFETNLETLFLKSRGKVRDIYEVGGYYLIVATDRISAFDVIMPNPIPDKGKVLTRMSEFWFRRTEGIIANHLITTDVRDFPEECVPYREILEGRSMLVKKARPLPVECVVRGYLGGSAWKDYCEGRPVSGIVLPAGLKESSKLAEPVFTPSTKAEQGQHDLPISQEEVGRLIGKDLADRVERTSLEVFVQASEAADTAGIIIADTKMEFGIIGDDLVLIDELLTPDSSRFWPKDEYEEGRSQNSFDKQFLRDYLLSIKWNKTPPAPQLPDDIIEKTAEKYREALERLTT
ncbi:MAG: phosphoribosylaminoimidazolesuccinocarboxamide synthase [Deltaproteobacteria bacterium]|nr:phosphoribosylaminoimidazolesuccinocarboxamide synthase [Deltaproteobacteria bacterium]